MIIWLMMALTAGGLVFAGVIFWALREPAERVLCLPVRENTMEYALWQAELRVQLGLYGAVELTGIPRDPETARICCLFMRGRPWVRFAPEVCKSAAGVLY